MDSLNENIKARSTTIKSVSRCIYCGSSSYGRGCKYAPKGVHFHPDDPKKCSYCGSTNYGRGCKINPFDNVHLHGINYNSMFKEQLQNNFLLSLLNKDVTDFEAYKLGIIDSNGNKIKEPITEQEILAYSPVTKTILKVKRYLGTKIDLINQTAILENSSKQNYNKENHKKVLQFEEKFDSIINDLHKTIDEALKEGLSIEQVHSLL